MDFLWFFVGDYVDVFMYKYLFWNCSGGVDYFMLLCYDWVSFYNFIFLWYGLFFEDV